MTFSAGDVGEALFYLQPDNASIASFRAHADQISVIAPQSYALDRHGNLHGSLRADLMAIAHDGGVQVMPLVVNSGFSRTNAIRFLASPAARDRAIGALVDQARDLALLGWQLDFENLPSTQRAAFSRFVAEAAEALHRHGKLLSVAVAARIVDDTYSDTYRKFSGVYDYTALANSADFLSVMAYPESDKDPGPLASSPWVSQVLQHVLLRAPAAKISLGLPTYQTDWTERRLRVRVRTRVAGQVKRVFHVFYRLIHRSGPVEVAPLQWDPRLESSYRVEGEGHDRRVTWVEDDRSFAAKLRFVDQYHLRGFSVWRLGLEDSRIWPELPAAVRAAQAPAPPP
ncbi:MAG: glycosyl hydrolase family 18 protein, partial [Terriglobales bacterium]